METIQIKGETIYLKKGWDGWHTCHPIKIDGKINWENLIAGGSWIKLGITLGFIFILVMAIFEVSSIYKIATDCLNKTIIMIKP